MKEKILQNMASVYILPDHASDGGFGFHFLTSAFDDRLEAKATFLFSIISSKFDTNSYVGQFRISRP
jgi:hypothetical protein